MNNFIKIYFQFVFGGGIGLLINIGITSFLTERFGLWYMYAYIVGLSINIIFNFIYHRNITFKIYDRAKRRFVHFIIFTFFITCINWLFVYIATTIYSFYYITSIIIITLIISVINYLTNALLIFRIK